MTTLDISDTISMCQKLLYTICEDPSTSRSVVTDIRRLLPALTLELLQRIPKVPQTYRSIAADVLARGLECCIEDTMLRINRDAHFAALQASTKGDK
jgi:hypothetical protein